MTRLVRALALGVGAFVALPLARAETTAAPARLAQNPSPAGAAKPLAEVVDRDDFTLALHGFGQFYAAPYAGKDSVVASGDAVEFAGMRARRLEVGLEGSTVHDLSFGIWMSLAEGPISLLEAWLAWEPTPEFAVEAGVVKVPFSRSALQSASELTFAERPLTVLELLPDRQPGVAVYGSLIGDTLTYRAGWFNGAAADQAAHGPDHPAGLFAGRLAYAPLGALRPDQTDVARGPLRLELAVDAMQNYAAAYTGTSFGADFTLQAYGAALLLEYVHDVKAPVAEPVTAPALPDVTTRHGYIAQASYVVWRELDVALRGELVDDNEALQDVGDVTDVVAGAHWTFPNVKAGLEWYHRVEMYGVPLDNDTLVGTLQGRF